jgi:segregation and condensation protein A
VSSGVDQVDPAGVRAERPAQCEAQPEASRADESELRSVSSRASREASAESGRGEQLHLTVSLPEFEGPLDLLLHLCRTNEVDLSRLPVRTITDQYVRNLEAMQFQDLEQAGAFMVLAATLIYLKSKLLLPPETTGDELLDEEGEALRDDLAQRLRAYARVQAAGAWLGQREAEQALLFGRPGSALPPPEEIPLEDLSVHLLEGAIRRLIDEQRRRRPREVDPSPPSVLERMSEILSLLRSTWSLLFSAVVGPERRRAELVVTLLALLELMRLGQARAEQLELFGDIVIAWGSGLGVGAVHEPEIPGVRGRGDGPEIPGVRGRGDGPEIEASHTTPLESRRHAGSD